MQVHAKKMKTTQMIENDVNVSNSRLTGDGIEILYNVLHECIRISELEKQQMNATGNKKFPFINYLLFC